MIWVYFFAYDPKGLNIKILKNLNTTLIKQFPDFIFHPEFIWQ